jgi:arylsulfatase A-like enzyme
MIRLLPALLVLLAAWRFARAQTPLNLLVVILDDVGWDSLALTNDDPAATFPPTPNLDALAADGVLFRRAYAHPTCTPTRAALLTGRHPFRTAMGTAITGPTSGPPLREEEITLPELLDTRPDLGRAHASFGKWHLAYDFDSARGVGGWSHYRGNILGAIPDYFNWARTVDGVTDFTNRYATTVQTDDALDWLGGLPPSQPWLLWIGYNAAHSPFHKPPNALHSYDSLAVPPSGPDRPYYEAAIEAMDTQLGRLLAAVDRSRTLIVVTGDNGSPGTVAQPPVAAARAKGTPYEGGCRVPLIIAGPEVLHPGRVSHEVVHVVDLWATLLEAAGAHTDLPPDRGLDSRSLWPILRAEPFLPAIPEVLVEQFGDGLPTNRAARAVIGPTHKLIRFAHGAEELYDLAADPMEATNLLVQAPGPATDALYAPLAARLEEWTEPARARLEEARWGAGSFATAVTPYFDHDYVLERAPAPGGPWNEPPGALAVPEGGRLILLDTHPPATGAVYRVQSIKP